MRLSHAMAAGCAALVLLFAVAAAAEPTAPQPWRILILRSWDAEFPVNLTREQALRKALVENAPRVVEIYTEDIDPVRLAPGWEPELEALLKRLYTNIHVDVLVASGPEPLEFLTRHRAAIWPDAAIVFYGVLDETLEGWKRPPRTAGVTMSFDVKGTLVAGLALAPEAKRVYFVAGNSDFERSFLDIAERELRQHQPQLEARRITGFTRDQTVARVSAVEPDSLVFFLAMLRSADGQFTQPPGGETMARIASASPVPVLTAVHSQFGRGPIGGSASRLDLHGRAAGLLVRSVLEGMSPDAIPVRLDPPPECVIDWRGLEYWDIPLRRVPPTCRIANRPVPLMQAYFWPFMALVIVAALEGALIWALVLQSRRRRLAEAEAAERRVQLAHVGRVSMMGALTASIAHEINQPMGAILSNADAAEMMLEQGTLDVAKLREILADIRSEDLRASEVIRGLRKMLSRQDVKMVPLNVNAEVADALRHLAFDAAHREVRIEPLFDPEVPAIVGDSVQLQQVIVNLVMNAMEAVHASPDSEREIRIVTRAHAAGAEIAVKDRGPGIAPDEAAKLLESFHTTKVDGMGLGLAIVRTIVEMHGGRLSFESNMPHGAIFRVWLPATGT